MSESIVGPPEVPASAPAAQELTPLPPHQYPLWVRLFALAVLLFFAASLFLFPKYFTAAKKLKLAKNAYSDNHFDEAIKNCDIVLASVPSSEDTKILLAKSIFAGKRKDLYERALDSLQGIELQSTDWDELKAVLPQQYLGLFDTKGKS